MRTRLAATLTCIALVAGACGACMSPEDRAAKVRLFTPGDERPAPPAFDWSRPEAALEMSAGEAARRLGGLDWSGNVSWTVKKGADPKNALHVVERHKVRETADGDFASSIEIDPGTSPGEVSGNEVVYAGKMTYAHSRFAPWRQRVNDRGQDAARFRDESFGALSDVAKLYGGALGLVPAGETSVNGRAAKRFNLVLSAAGKAARPPSDAVYAEQGPDADTRKRLELLEGAQPVRAEGELVLDAATGVPLAATLRGAFKVKADPLALAEVELDGRVHAAGDAVKAIDPPKQFLPDEGKARGVAKALEEAGLKRTDAGAEEDEEPGGEGE